MDILRSFTFSQLLDVLPFCNTGCKIEYIYGFGFDLSDECYDATCYIGGWLCQQTFTELFSVSEAHESFNYISSLNVSIDFPLHL